MNNNNNNKKIKVFVATYTNEGLKFQHLQPIQRRGRSESSRSEGDFGGD